MSEICHLWRTYSKETVENLQQVIAQSGTVLVPRGYHRGSEIPVMEARFYQNNKTQGILNFVEMYGDEENSDGKMYLICWIAASR
jgi:hypothetical protein